MNRSVRPKVRSGMISSENRDSSNMLFEEETTNTTTITDISERIGNYGVSTESVVSTPGTSNQRQFWLREVAVEDYFVELLMEEKNRADLETVDLKAPRNGNRFMGGAGSGKNTSRNYQGEEDESSKPPLIVRCNLKDIPAGASVEEYLQRMCMEALIKKAVETVQASKK